MVRVGEVTIVVGSVGVSHTPPIAVELRGRSVIVLLGGDEQPASAAAVTTVAAQPKRLRLRASIGA